MQHEHCFVCQLSMDRYNFPAFKADTEAPPQCQMASYPIYSILYMQLLARYGDYMQHDIPKCWSL